MLEFLETDVAAATSAGNDAELMRVFSLYIGLEDTCRASSHAGVGQRAGRQGLLAWSIHIRTSSLLALLCRKR